jgi:uncharacterized protein YgbK (DUF1537 family)
MILKELKTGKIIVVADDFTGANDTGVQFSKKQLKSMVILDKDHIKKSLNDCDVLIIDTESRFDDREKAYRKTYETGQILKTLPVKCLYKKLDSTFRGNIGAELAGLMESTGIKHTVVVPAYPSNKRITRNGNVYVNGILLKETEFAADPRTPVNESYIPKIISGQTDKSIAVINFQEVHSGKEKLTRKLQQHISNGIEVIVIDVIDDKDLDMIASVTVPMKDKILFAGSTGFAEYLPKYLDPEKEKKINVVIAGSVSDVTRQQILYAKEKLEITLVDIDIEKLLSGNTHQEKNRISHIVKVSSGRGEDIIIRSAPAVTSSAESCILGQKYGLSGDDVSEAVALFLGEIARDIIQEIPLNGILLTGGDIAIKTVQSLNVSGTIIQDEIQPGIPYGHFIEEQYKNITVVTKAGGFGSGDAVFQILNFLKERRKK